MKTTYDIAIVGGGINGCGIAADAASRGLSVILLEKGDVAAKTSSSSTKLIHGGLRYLETGEFSLVKKALQEREILLRLAPFLIRPLPIILPHTPSLRALWLLRLGVFFYDHMSRTSSLPTGKKVVRQEKNPYFSPLSSSFNKGILFYDAKTDDARLTLVNALQAKNHGASICPYTTLIDAHPQQGHWHLRVANPCYSTIKAKVLINASGPWVLATQQKCGIQTSPSLRFVQGSHIVVTKLYEGEHAYLLQHSDKRIVFVIPYHGHTLIGTTDIPFYGNPDAVTIQEEEKAYLLQLIASYFSTSLASIRILHTFSGVRSLLANEETLPQYASREYALELQEAPAPLLSVYGGKITTYRRLAEEAVNLLQPFFIRLAKSRTLTLPLPGGEDFFLYEKEARLRYFWLEPPLLQRYLHTYGTRCEELLQGCYKKANLGPHFGQGLYQKEVEFLYEKEWARDAESMLQRRTQLGLHFSEAEKNALAHFLTKTHPRQHPSHSPLDLKPAPPMHRGHSRKTSALLNK